MSDELIAEPEVEVDARTPEDLTLRVNTYARLRDERRGFENRLGGLDHTQRGAVEAQIAEIADQIHDATIWIRNYRTQILAPRYREDILAIVTAKTEAAAKQVELQDAEAEIVAAEKQSYETWLLMRNTARAAGQETPPRFDLPKPKSRSGQLSSWSPGLPS